MENEGYSPLVERRLEQYRRRILELENQNKYLIRKMQRRPKLELDLLGLHNGMLVIDYYEMKSASIEMNYMPLSVDDIPPALEGLVTPKDLVDYNCLLPDAATIKEYMDRYYRYQRMTEGKFELLMKVMNNGTAKAHNIRITMKFPPELIVKTKAEIEELIEPKPPYVPENPIFLAYKKKLAGNPLNVFEKANIHTLKLSYKSNHLPKKPEKETDTFSSGFRCSISNNIVSIGMNSLLHTNSEVIDEICIISLCKGSFEVWYSVFCEEYMEVATDSFTIIVE